MPVTPFHIIAAAPIKALAPRKFSWMVFALTNVLIDLEPISCYLITLEPRHMFFHTIIGATLVAIFAATIGRVWCEKAMELWNEEDQMGSWAISDTTISKAAAWIGALLGAWTHLLLDSFMHFDIKPLSPFTDVNILLGAVSIGWLHFLCVTSGIIGLVLVMMLKAKKPPNY